MYASPTIVKPVPTGTNCCAANRAIEVAITHLVRLRPIGSIASLLSSEHRARARWRNNNPLLSRRSMALLRPKRQLMIQKQFNRIQCSALVCAIAADDRRERAGRLVGARDHGMKIINNNDPISARQRQIQPRFSSYRVVSPAARVVRTTRTCLSQ